ncbi:MAG: hypothetical protein LUD19_01265 [Clostridia bacterium]|nr:hypothetical protein [Clostridia bacterium]
MTIEQASDYIPDFDSFELTMCDNCAAVFDGGCPSNCYELEKAKQIGYKRILKSYARNDGDLVKVTDFIRRARAKNG